MKNYAYYSKISLKTKILNEIRKFFIAGKLEKFLVKRILRSKDPSPWLKVIPPEYLYPQDSWRTYERDGIKLRLNISNVVDHLKYFSFKDEGFENFRKKIQDSFTILDIGGNIGVTCIEFAKVTPKGKVIVFEPSLSNFKRLRENIGLNKFENIISVNMGIGDNPGQFNLYNVVNSNPGMKRILEIEDVSDFESESIIIDTLDNQLNQLNIQEVNAIKIDVEGFEFKVLQSATFILKKHHPILFIELDDSNLKGQKSSAIELVSFLKELNYVIFNALEINTPLSSDFNFSNCHFDIICE